ncbi:precorrin-3B C(17)-methyltransferase [Roseomonas elaeocarpi]|uniref:Precorrin-3B C(17)-methyltransferase n=1 Tax=Roseomonas elaeocarpi TaxID=907779 RepID=A0ABV6JVK2_9PROT
MTGNGTDGADTVPAQGKAGGVDARGSAADGVTGTRAGAGAGGADGPPVPGGWLRVVGLGPGGAGLVTPEVSETLRTATDAVGYGPYLARVPARSGLRCHASDNRVELERAAAALRLAAEGRRVAVVSAGDAGVFGMAAALFEAMERGPVSWREIDLAVLPGVSAMFAVAARAGAPLGHDFCAISLSDNLKPWALVEHRLRLAAEAGFTVALYNPISRARPWQLGRAFELLREVLPAVIPVIFATAVSRADERVVVTTLGEALPAMADMRTLVMVGTAETRLLPRADGGSWVYAPRSAPDSGPASLAGDAAQSAVAPGEDAAPASARVTVPGGSTGAGQATEPAAAGEDAAP